MKIIVITSSFPRYEGDFMGNFTYELAKGLKERKNEIFILGPHANNLKFEEKIIEDLKVYRFPYFYPFRYQKLSYGNGIPYNLKTSYLAKIQVPMFFLSELINTIRIIKKEKIEIIHSHWLVPQGLVGAICHKIFGAPHIATIHSSEISLLKKMPMGMKMVEFILNNSDVIVSVSSHRIENLLRSISPKIRGVIKEKIEIIPMGINLNELRTKKIDKDKLKVICDADSNFIVLFVGRLVECKGCEYLIKGFKSLISKQNNVKLIIVGSGDLETKLKKMVDELNLSEHIKFEGFVEHNNIGNYYSISDVVVFPSIVDSSGFEEGLPVVLLEALSAGKPIVATRTKGVMEVIENGYNGILVDQKNPKQISDAILMILNNSQLSDRLSKNALESGKKYSWDIIVEKYLKIINKCVKNE